MAGKNPAVTGVITVTEGQLTGVCTEDGAVEVYAGVPYARPPVGELRWKEPQPPEPWEGVRVCDTFAPMSMQPRNHPIMSSLTQIFGFHTYEFSLKDNWIEAMSEDSLYLNIWKPAGDVSGLPVLFYIHGGSLTTGQPSYSEYNGESLAREGIVVVNVGYRLGVFGFLAHPELTAESPDQPTNFGHLDQQAGIAWVKRNIAAFGGNPDNITIFGQSAGAGSCMVQLASPQNKGLFRRAILHSGGGFLPPSSLSLHLDEAEKQGVKLFGKLGVKTLAEARALDAQFIWDAAVGQRGFNWGSVIGDEFLPDTPVNIFLRGEENDADLILGNTGDEFLVQPRGASFQEVEAYVRKKYPAIAEEFLSLMGCCAITLGQMKLNATYNNFEMGNVLWLDHNARQPKHKMYFYRFDPEIPGWDDPGAFHSSDLWFAFETLAKCWRPFTGKHYDLARQMCNYWTNFARSGDPNGPDADGSPMEPWEPYTEDNKKVMFFGDKPELTAAEESDFFRLLQHACEEGKISYEALNAFNHD